MKRVNKHSVRRGKNYFRVLLILLVICWFIVLIMFPLYGILKEVIGNGFAKFFESINSPASRHAFKLTFLITLTAIILNTLFGIIMALMFVKQTFRGKLLLEGLIDLPFAVSPVIAGLMFIILFGPRGWMGNWFGVHGIKIIYALPGMLIATLFVTFPFIVREVIPVLKEFGLEQEEAAYVLGATKWQTFWKVTLPSIKWGLLYGIILTFARSIGEFGAVLVVSGSIINRTQTATLFIHQQFTDFNFSGAFSASLVLALLSFILLVSMKFIYKRKEKSNNGHNLDWYF